MNLSSVEIRISGRVQGVGFRPFVARLAHELGVNGNIRNSNFGVDIQATGHVEKLHVLAERIRDEAPRGSYISSLSLSPIPAPTPTPVNAFQILKSENLGKIQSYVGADIAPCETCLEEMRDPKNRRFRYPFISCAQCGPRDSITEALPFDRERTTLQDFPLCANCLREFENSSDRRFHAVTTNCIDCGPIVELRDGQGLLLAKGHNAISNTINELRLGKVIAVKGIGGFQLLGLAENESTIQQIRKLKQRASKSLAVLFPHLELLKEYAELSNSEADLLRSDAAPIVLLRSRKKLPDSIAPGLDTLGAMLPHSPLHHLLSHEVSAPLIATSANLSDLPLCTEVEPLRIAIPECQFFLTHNRRIHREMDDSVVQMACGKLQVLRRARGFSAIPFLIPINEGILAVGGHLKNSLVQTLENQVHTSPHIGDLDTAEARARLLREIEVLKVRVVAEPTTVVCDLHPDYASTLMATEMHLPLMSVQHHEAHAWACAAEHGVQAPWCAVSWDGTGLGTDGSLWGGEFFKTNVENSISRIASLSPFLLPRGASREPRRSALGFVYQMIQNGASVDPEWESCLRRSFSLSDLKNLKILLGQNQGNISSSMGRLFDAVACLLLERTHSDYEGQAAMELEAVARGGVADNEFHFLSRETNGLTRLDWTPLLNQMAEQKRSGVNISDLAYSFHRALARLILNIATKSSSHTVLLSGGVFQNKLLLEQTEKLLTQHEFKVYWPMQNPPNDGGLALGQAYSVARRPHVPRHSG